MAERSDVRAIADLPQTWMLETRNREPAAEIDPPDGAFLGIRSDSGKLPDLMPEPAHPHAARGAVVWTDGAVGDDWQGVLS